MAVRVAGVYAISSGGSGSYPGPVTGVQGTFSDPSLLGFDENDVSVGDYVIVQMPDQSCWRWVIDAITGTSPLQLTLSFDDDATGWNAAFTSAPISTGAQLIVGKKEAGGAAYIPSYTVLGVSEALTAAAQSVNAFEESTLSDGVVVEAKLADSAVTVDKIAPATIVDAKIADGTITPQKIINFDQYDFVAKASAGNGAPEQVNLRTSGGITLTRTVDAGKEVLTLDGAAVAGGTLTYNDATRELEIDASAVDTLPLVSGTVDGMFPTADYNAWQTVKNGPTALTDFNHLELPIRIDGASGVLETGKLVAEAGSGLDITVDAANVKFSLDTVEARTLIGRADGTTDGLVPFKGGDEGDANKFLNANNQWTSPATSSTNLSLGTVTATVVPIDNDSGDGVTLPAATGSLAGLMVATDKAKLDLISTLTTSINLDDIPVTKLAPIATNTVLGRITAATGDVEVLTQANLRTLIALADATNNGLAPTKGGDEGSTTKFLRADNTWQVPPSGSGASNLSEGTHTGTTFVISNDNGSGITITAADATYAGVMSNTDKIKLDYISPLTSTIDLDDIPVSRLADVAQDTVLGRVNAGTGVVEVLTQANLRTVVGNSSGSNAGLMTSTQFNELANADTCLGVSSAANLGNFTGDLFSPNFSVKQVLQEAETAIEASHALQGLDTNLDYTGATDQRAALAALISAGSGGIIQLDEGTIRVDGSSTINIPAGTTIRGRGPGKTIISCESPAASHTFFTITGDNVTLENLDFVWAPGDYVPSGSGQFIIAIGRDAFKMKGVNLIGPGEVQDHYLTGHNCLSMWQCTNAVLEDCVIKWALGSAFGMDQIGGSGHKFLRCKFLENGADGVKLQCSNTYGVTDSFSFIDCEFNGNGQIVIQGQDSAPMASTITGTGSLPAATSGLRHRMNFGSPGTLSIPAASGVAAGTVILLSKVVGSANVTLDFDAGDSVSTSVGFTDGYVWGSAAGSDYLLIRLTRTGATQWTTDAFTNGQGLDSYGHNHSFVNCIADGNETAGFQVKPVGGAGVNDTPGYSSTGISFLNCHARNGWSYTASGFLISPSSASGTPVPTDIKYTNCVAYNNKSHGFGAQTESTRHVLYTNCISRSNSTGFQVQKWCKNASFVNCVAMGNGKYTTGWGWYIQGTTNTQLQNCYILGVDPADQQLETEAEIAAATPRGYGMFIDIDPGSSPLTGLRLDNVQFEKCTLYNNSPIRWYTAGTPVASPAGAIGKTNLLHVEDIPLHELYVWDSNSRLPGTAATDDLGYNNNTWGSSLPFITTRDGEAGTSIDGYARFRCRLPDHYLPGDLVYVRIGAVATPNVADSSMTLDLECYETSDGLAISSDICADTPKSMNSLTPANYDFKITPTGLLPGDVLHFRIKINIADTTATGSVYGTIYKIQVASVSCY